MTAFRPRSRASSVAPLVLAAALSAWSAPTTAQQQQAADPDGADFVVTATGRREPVSRIAGTMQVITQERIANSSAKSVTDILAENAVGFMSEWTAGQTSLNIRGGSTEGQGRDFRSQVLILINGHRAGTANISKLSLAEVERIEIVRGPSSVVYGSGNMGGVVNIITKSGLTAPGGLLEGAVGSWNLFQGRLQYGGQTGKFDYYAGFAANTRDDYQAGGGQVETNTHWTRYGGLAALGYQFDEDNHIALNVRSDGIYDAGFRGSNTNIFAFDNRYNQSIDLTYFGRTPDKKGSLMFQAYYVRDVDDLQNPSPLSRLNAPAARTFFDRNRRQQDIVGTRFQPGFKPWEGNDMLLGFDWERSWLRSDRWRRGGSAVTDLSPQDNNQTDEVYAFYIEDAQRLLDDRLTVRGGVRQTIGSTTLDWTPNAPTLLSSSKPYQATTYSAGATFRVADWLNTRVGASSGFRAPTATELGANFTTTPIGNTIFGNPGLAPETSRQLEAGATITWGAGRFDLAVFENIISNRIRSVVLSTVGGRTISQQQNNPGDIQVQGIEFQAEADMVRTLELDVPQSWQWSVFGSGFYNFRMLDYGAVPAARTNIATRINEHELAIGTRFGQAGNEYPWSFQIIGLWRGPMWYNTEESLSPVFFPGQITSTSVYRKEAFWVWNARGEVEVRKNVKLFVAMNNIFDVNQHPIFIATDVNPCVANLINQNGAGACGNSIPGREVIVGFQLRF